MQHEGRLIYATFLLVFYGLLAPTRGYAGPHDIKLRSLIQAPTKKDHKSYPAHHGSRLMHVAKIFTRALRLLAPTRGYVPYWPVYLVCTQSEELTGVLF